MDSALFWLILGVALIAAEFLIPGLVVVFLGVAALLVSAGVHFGLLEGWMQILTAWFVLSLALVLLLRGLFARFMPGERETVNIDEDVDAFGKIVKVVRLINEDGTKARVSFRGAEWDAVSEDFPLKPGGTARLLGRDNLVWIVEPWDIEEDEFAKEEGG